MKAQISVVINYWGQLCLLVKYLIRKGLVKLLQTFMIIYQS